MLIYSQSQSSDEIRSNAYIPLCCLTDCCRHSATELDYSSAKIQRGMDFGSSHPSQYLNSQMWRLHMYFVDDFVVIVVVVVVANVVTS